MTHTLGAGERRSPSGFLDAVTAHGTQPVDAALALVRAEYQELLDRGVSADDLPNISNLTLEDATTIFADLLAWEAWLDGPH
jgi:hypothetical protein